MNLIIDIGNTSTKLALYDKDERFSQWRISELNCLELEKILTENYVKQAIVSSTRSLSQFMKDLLTANIPSIHFLSYKTSLSFKIAYDTPETLGTDRIAAAAGAYKFYPAANILVIDAGTALTYEFLTGDTYRGGNISPGISMRFKALNKFTEKLPLLDLQEIVTNPGKNTNEAIVAGVISGVVYEINEYIRTFEKEFKDPKIILTGGDGEFLKDKLKHQIIYKPDIVIDGLNYILEYNAK